MSKIKIKPSLLLTTFLKSKRLYAPFMREVEGQQKCRDNIDTIKDGFLWFDSKWGNEFWSKVDKEFTEAMTPPTIVNKFRE